MKQTVLAAVANLWWRIQNNWLNFKSSFSHISVACPVQEWVLNALHCWLLTCPGLTNKFGLKLCWPTKISYRPKRYFSEIPDTKNIPWFWKKLGSDRLVRIRYQVLVRPRLLCLRYHICMIKLTTFFMFLAQTSALYDTMRLYRSSRSTAFFFFAQLFDTVSQQKFWITCTLHRLISFIKVH